MREPASSARVCRAVLVEGWLADPKSEVAPAYGEGDTEAKAMSEAAKGEKQPDNAANAPTPPGDVALPAAGTTETDLARNLRDKAARGND